MPTIAEQLTQLESDRQDLVSNLQTKGITGLTGDETFTALVPEVLNIPSGNNDIDGLLDDSLVDLVSNCTKVLSYACYGRASLKTVHLPLALSIESFAFQYCYYLETLTLESATTIQGNAFQNCTRLTSVNVPSANNIAGYAFQNCSGLVNVSLPSISTLNGRVFEGCTSLANVYLDVCTAMGGNVFYGCTSLSSITLGADSVCSILTSSLPSQHLTIYVPSNLISSYQTATNWSTLYNNNKVTFVAIS